MKKQKFKVLLLTAALAFSSCIFAAVAGAAEITVDSANDLQNVLDSANPGDVIKGNGVEISGSITVNVPCTITGFEFTGDGITDNSDYALTLSGSQSGPNGFVVTNCTFTDKGSIKATVNGNVSVTNCTFTATEKYSKSEKNYSALRTPVSLTVNGVVTVTGNTFGGLSEGYYNPIELSIDKEYRTASGTSISDNTFNAKVQNNNISMYSIAEGAKIHILNNTFAYSNNAVRLSNTNNSHATFYMFGNTYNDVDKGEYEGFLLLQDFTGVQDFAKFNIIIEDLVGPGGVQMTDNTTKGQVYYVYRDSVGILTENQPKLSFAGVACKIGETDYYSLKDAIAAATSGDEIVLQRNIDISEGISIDKKLTLNLSGYNITSNKVRANLVLLPTADVTITGEGTIQESAGTAYLAPIVMYGSTDASGTGSKLVVDKGVTLKGWSGLMIDHNNARMYGIKADIHGTLTGIDDCDGANGSAIYINGTSQIGTNCPVINIHNGANLSGSGLGVFASGYAEWNIGNATITGDEALAIKSGRWNINGGTFTATGEYKNPVEANNNGSEATGAAVSVTSTYSRLSDSPIIINITGGTFISENGCAFYAGHSKSGDTTYYYKNGLEINVTGGTFTGGSAEDAASMYIAPIEESDNNYTYTIAGGSYSTDISDYLAPDTAIGQGADEMYNVISSKNKATKTGTYTTAVGDNGTYDQMSLFDADGISGSVTYNVKTGETIKDFTFDCASVDSLTKLGLIVTDIPSTQTVTVELGGQNNG